MSVSLGILTALIVLLMMGAGQRILDQLRLNDKQAIILLLLIVVGIIIPPINIAGVVMFSIGGFIIPFGLCIYLLVCVGWSRDLLRALIGTIIVAGVIYGLEWLMPADPEELIIDPMIIYGLVAGIVAYVLGRSRRNAFICAVLGVTLSMLVQFIINIAVGTPTVLGLGVGGAFSTMMVSIIIAVALAEFLGRAFESAMPEGDKKFNFETSQYDSVKNGRLAFAGNSSSIVTTANRSQSANNGLKPTTKTAKPSENVKNSAKKSKSKIKSAENKMTNKN